MGTQIQHSVADCVTAAICERCGGSWHLRTERLQQDLGLDYSDVLELLLQLEDLLGADILEGDADAVGTVGDLIRVVEKAIGSGGGHEA